ncbi:hypothetical protein QI334_08515 [Staphylococcus saprophyticus]|uniref:hypothetical protein n=1 Tax=Staphylococcus saprophyticus TaxID=29385 RepID=UPI00076B1A68|nr:hypothetical protein [Staphylococcus saprophyticus]AMG19044.1 hypothetical protein AL528_01880 [Staphylococcus saprophyticus]MDW3863140.1 hypothetical protein [Staphylococcus saprophyticus]MDW3915147.1 hypothetical protein [Staphylococcus saprophyticus]MDW3925381.1 hypothetical protein [Staphylococcus saprophyticus]MDW3963141.1 hypothetical protein [Staphylococcus saprophyticus]
MAIIALIISIISILITIFITVRNLLAERKNVKVEIINQAYLINIKRVHLNVIFTNKSKNPISITGLSITSQIKDKIITRYGRYLKHEVAHTAKNGEIKQEITNTTIPISIEPYGAIYALITIDLIDHKNEEFLNDSSYITIYTSRGKLKDYIYTKNIKKIDAISMLDFPNK